MSYKLDTLSAFAVIYERSNTTGNPVVFNRIMERLKHRGPDGSDIVSINNVTMGHWHFWTTPEEVGERQPLELDGLPFKIVLDGRLDNREELFEKLNMPAEGKTVSDAALILQAYARWGDRCFERFIGEFAIVIFDKNLDEIICARDPLGDRSLFYAFHDAAIVIASEPWAVAGIHPVAPELSESAIVHYLALKTPEDGQTFFNDVYEFKSAHIMKIGANRQNAWRYWNPDPLKKIRYKTDAEYAQRFLTLLEESVRCRMRSSLPLGVLMSGGLDSTSVASLAARESAPETLKTLSYVFDELPECDERPYIDAMKERWKIRSIQFTGDASWTFKDWESWPRNPNQPERNIYRLLIENAYKRANAEGIGVLLTGYMGDHLYFACKDWIADLIVDGQLKKAATELIFQIKNMGLKKTLKTGHFRRLARRIADSISPGAIRLPRKNNAPAWINPNYAGRLTYPKDMNPVFERHGALLTSVASKDISYTTSIASPYALELRNPYRDRRLVEFILALPAYQLYQRGFIKHILRAAMQNILPESIRIRAGQTSFKSLYFRGVEREKKTYAFYLQNAQATWKKFLRADWNSKISDNAHTDDLKELLAFSCVSYETWRHYFFSKI